ncbi:MAG: hypothetical protein ACYSX1_06635 [Planctomycetota bacterium]|jgi:hypothetical protein
MTETVQQQAAQDEWNYKHLICALVVAFVLQSIVHPCLCQIGTAKTVFALVFDALILARIVVAKLRKEKGKGWLFYAILLYTSPAWIELGTWILVGKH